MKLQGLVKVCAAMLFCLSNQQLLAQQLKLGTNPTLLDKNALLELKSDKQGFLLPRIIKAQILAGGALYNAAEGMLVYITDDKALYLKKTTGWEKIDFSILTAGTGIDITGNSIKNIGVTSFKTRTGDVLPVAGDYALTQLSDVNITSPANNQLLQYQSGKWINSTLSFVPTTRQVSFSAGTGISAVTAAPAGNDLSVDRTWTIVADNSNNIWNANKLQGKSILTTAPNEGDLLTFTGGSWTPKAAAATGVNTINTLSAAAQLLRPLYNAGTTSYGFTSATDTHTLTIADASATLGGLVNLNAQTFKGAKTFNDGIVTSTLRINTDAGGAATKILGKDANGDVSSLTTDATLAINTTTKQLGANNGTKLWNANKIADWDVLFSTAPANGDVLSFNGTQWISKAAPATGVTSVGLSLPSLFTVTNSPVTATGTLTATLNTQSPNVVFAGPATGSTAAAPAFRPLVANDIPDISGTYIRNTTTTQATSNFNISGNGTLGGTLRLTNLAAATPTAATSKVLSINSAGDVIVTDNAATTNWLTGGNNATSTQFLGTINATDMVVKYNNKELFRGSRGQTAAESGGTDFSASTLTLLNGATKFNGHPLIIRANGNDVLAFEDATGTPKWHWNILGGGLNFVETNVKDYRLFLQNGGNVGVGTNTPAALLDVAGTAKLGTDGTVLNGVYRAVNVNCTSINGNTGTTSVPNSATGTATVTFAVANVDGTLGGNVIINPRFDFPFTLRLISSRVSADNTVTAVFVNTGTAGYSLSGTTRRFDITVIQ
jgi:hypothetical protein